MYKIKEFINIYIYIYIVLKSNFINIIFRNKNTHTMVMIETLEK